MPDLGGSSRADQGAGTATGGQNTDRQTPDGRLPGSAGAAERPEKAETQVRTIAVWVIVNSFT